MSTTPRAPAASSVPTWRDHPSGAADLGAGYQRARRMAAVAAIAALVVVGLILDDISLLVVAGLALLVLIHSRYRSSPTTDSAVESLLVDATVLAASLLLVRPPPLVALPPLTYLVVVTPLVVQGRRAAWTVTYGLLVTGAALFLIQGSMPEWGFATTMVFTLITAACTVPGMFRLLQAAQRAMSERQTLERRLQEREERYRGLVEGIPVGIYRTTPDGRILTANPALAEMLGYADPDQLMGVAVEDIYSDPSLRVEWRKQLEARGTVRAWEIPLRRRDGDLIWVRDAGRVVRDSDGGIRFYEGTLEDVTERKRAMDALLESEERYRALVEASPLAIAVHSEGRVVYANQATAGLLGASSPADLIGREVLEFVHPEQREVVRGRMRQVIEERSDVPLMEERFVRLDGEVIEVEVAAIPTWHNGKPASQLVVRDVTAHKRAEREAQARRHELDRLFSLTAEVNAGRSVSDILEGIFDTFRELIPYDRMEYADLEEGGTVLRTRWVRAGYDRLLLPPGHVYRRPNPILKEAREARPMIDNDLEAYARSRPEGNPTRLLVAEGLRSSLSCPLLLHDQVVGYLFFSSRRPDAYEPTHATLVDRVASQIAAAIQQSRLRDELMARNRELEALNRSRTQFLANVSHELRTPLTAVVGLAAEMRDRLAELSRDEVVDFAELIAASSSEVAGIVEDLLVIARVEAGQLSVVPEPVDLEATVRLAIETWSPEEAGRISVTGGDAQAWADPRRVRQIVRNLCSNARRYGGERIEVRVWTNGDFTGVVVADDGPGIPEPHRESVFEAYVRAGTDRTRSSVGLGLTVSRQLARAMGGDLRYEYEAGESRFELRLPVPSTADRMETAVG